ncbi:GAD-like domain-containing protein [Enterobacter sp. GD03975]|uniref:GAD-like domain-containing protein n=1 Tax=Enterobacter sp. GD03975 TaxID=2975412 RepID=UPI00244B0B44|nr:GAD-like domain-containing protein [Enterobacter sp. GD03975]MDH1125689.1 DUF1851 domain-containing protein [Enterobacter sp. GD03975]
MMMKEIRDDDFAGFIEIFGEATKSTIVSDSHVQKWREILPNQLLRYWKIEGWNTYRHGLLSIVNPDNYEDILDIWLENTFLEERDSYHVIARTGFGSLYACGEQSGRNLIIDCYNHSIYFSKNNAFVKPQDKLDSEIRSFFGASNIERFDLRNESGEYLFERAVNKLGPLNDDEIFGFEPALIFGGVEDIKHIVKVNAQVHLTLLREFSEPTIYEL